MKVLKALTLYTHTHTHTRILEDTINWSKEEVRATEVSILPRDIII